MITFYRQLHQPVRSFPNSGCTVFQNFPRTGGVIADLSAGMFCHTGEFVPECQLVATQINIKFQTLSPIEVNRQTE